MKKVTLTTAFAIGMTGACVRKTVKMEKTGSDTEETTNLGGTETTPLPDKEDARRNPSTGDLSDGLTHPAVFDRTIPPYASEAILNRAVHLILPAAIKYMDLGSADILAGKADGSRNVLRVKAALGDFSREANLAVITDDGSHYTFNVKYVDKPTRLNIEMKDSIHDGEAVNRPDNSQEIYLTEPGSESPLLVQLITKSVYDNNKRLTKYTSYKRFGIRYISKGIYMHNGLPYFHTELKNASNVPFSVDFATFKVIDKRAAKRTAIQEQVIVPPRAFNHVTVVDGKSREQTTSILPGFVFPDDKQLVVEMNEQNGERHRWFILTNAELIHTRVINELKVKQYEKGICYYVYVFVLYPDG